MQTKDEILEQIKASLTELFELEPGQITLAARLNEDYRYRMADEASIEDFEDTIIVVVGVGFAVFSTAGVFANKAKQHKCET